MSDHIPPENPVALVTGGGTGVGAETSKLLAARGYRVAVNYRASGAAANETAEKCGEMAGDAVALQGDVSSDADCCVLTTAVTDRWGRLDVLVCNAGTTQFSNLADFENQNAEDFHRIYDVNLTGPKSLLQNDLMFFKPLRDSVSCA